MTKHSCQTFGNKTTTSFNELPTASAPSFEQFFDGRLLKNVTRLSLQNQFQTPSNAVVMAPLSPLSSKRSTSPVELNDIEHVGKRSRTEESPGEDMERGSTKGSDVPHPKITYFGEDLDIYNKDPQQLLRRSVALALDHVGFDGASKEAIEAVCAEADVCKSILRKLTMSKQL